MIWIRADNPFPAKNLDPLSFGWNHQGGTYSPIWYTGPMMPPEIALAAAAESEDRSPNEVVNDSDAWSESSDED